MRNHQILSPFRNQTGTNQWQSWRVLNYRVIDHSDWFRCQWSETSESERSESTLMLGEFADRCWLLKNRNYCLRDDTLTSWRRESTTTTGETGLLRSALLVSVDVTFAVCLWWVAGRTWWRVAWWSILTPWRRRLWCSPWPLMTFRKRVWHTARPTHTVRFTRPWSLESVLLLFRSLTTTRYDKRNESTLTHNNSCFFPPPVESQTSFMHPHWTRTSQRDRLALAG